jgi:hypothetical protein
MSVASASSYVRWSWCWCGEGISTTPREATHLGEVDEPFKRTAGV